MSYSPPSKNTEIGWFLDILRELLNPYDFLGRLCLQKSVANEMIVLFLCQSQGVRTKSHIVPEILLNYLIAVDGVYFPFTMTFQKLLANAS